MQIYILEKVLSIGSISKLLGWNVSSTTDLTCKKSPKISWNVISIEKLILPKKKFELIKKGSHYSSGGTWYQKHWVSGVNIFTWYQNHWVSGFTINNNKKRHTWYQKHWVSGVLIFTWYQNHWVSGFTINNNNKKHHTWYQKH